MNKIRSWKRAAVAANFLFLTTLPSLALGQSAPPVTPQSRQMSTLQPAPRASNQPMDIFAGLTYTEEQKAKIEQIQQSSRTRMEAVVKDEKLNPDQKRAMLDGLQRIERSEIFKALTQDQQKEVLQKITAQRAAAKTRNN